MYLLMRKLTPVTNCEKTAMLALLAIGFLLLCETVLILVGEHFNSVPDYYGRRHRTFVHLLSGVLLGAFIATVCYASWVHTMELRRCILAYIVLLFIFLGLLLLHQMLRTPHLTHYPTTVFLFVLVSYVRSLAKSRRVG